ncbi:vanadium-dependent haloperoxidase [Flavihumibacter sp. R14]|nr:vanadium-dependent haloperoxidase [Flavihumibacter soli]
MKANHIISSSIPRMLLIVVFFFLPCCKEEAPMEVNQIVKPSTKTSGESGALVTDWYTLQLDILRKSDPSISNLVILRSFGYTAIGLYESVRPGIDKSVSLSTLLYQMPPMPLKEDSQEYSWAVSANSAIAKLIAYFYPPAVVTLNKTRLDSIENANNNKLGLTLESAVFDRSQAYGQSIADAIIAWSKTDNVNLGNAGYVPPVFPGAWVPTPPAFGNAAGPYYGSTRPFLQENLQSLTGPLGFGYGEVPGCEFYKMVKDIYDLSKKLTEDQKNVALYWNDLGVGVGFSPPGHSVSILTQILVEKNCSLETAAIAYAKTAIAAYDATIVCWKSKYTYNVIRPVSYIQKVIDPSWSPLIITPPHPEYPGAHSFITGAYMQVMTGLFGDSYSFTDNTYGSKFGGPRTYSSFNAAAEECGESRRYGGIHYTPSTIAGLKNGREVGERINDLELVDK